MDANTLLSYKTDPQALERLTKLARRTMTPAEAFQQRVSYVFGSIDCDNNVSREQVEELLIKQHGAGVTA